MRHELTSHHYYIGLLAGLLTVFLVSPFFGHGSSGSDLLSIALIVTLLFGVLAINRSKKLMFATTLIAAPLIADSINFVFGSGFSVDPILSATSGALFVLVIICIMLRDMFSSTEVDGALIVGAISLYLLLGLMWGFFYLIINSVYPGSFHYDVFGAIEEPANALMYYSMVTLTTLGYGDIAPISAPARAMSTIQAATGQIYLTVLVARLIGMHIAQSSKHKKS